MPRPAKTSPQDSWSLNIGGVDLPISKGPGPWAVMNLNGMVGYKYNL